MKQHDDGWREGREEVGSMEREGKNINFISLIKKAILRLTGDGWKEQLMDE